jgi:hypothetical protein
LQLAQEVAEHVVHPEEAFLSLLLPPPIPKEEISFVMSLLLQYLQETSFSFPMETRVSNRFPHSLHKNS